LYSTCYPFNFPPFHYLSRTCFFDERLSLCSPVRTGLRPDDKGFPAAQGPVCRIV
jgi:hypothetical protein